MNAAVLRDAGIAALAALVLAIPMVGFRTIDSVTGITLETRWLLVAYAVIGVFALRLIVLLTRGHFAKAKKEKTVTVKPVIWDKWALPVVAVFLLLFPFLPFTDRYVLDVAIMVLTYVTLGWGLNVVVGYTGLLDLGYVAFYAIGAYAYALLALYFNFTFWEALPCAALTAGFFAFLVGIPVLRLRGDYLAIVTLGFAEITRIVLINWTGLTGGPNGVSNIPRPTLFGLPFARPEEGMGPTFSSFFGLEYDPLHRVIYFYFLTLAMVAFIAWLCSSLRKSPLGQSWEAIREDEIAAVAMGVNPAKAKLSAYVVGAMIAGCAGCLFATRQGFISPESFTSIESFTVLAIIVLGGLGNLWGVFLAAIFIIGLPELFRDLEQYRMLAFGAGMVLIMLWRPQGLLSYREPTVTLKAAVMPAKAGIPFN